jgi:Tfp pilus assembly protein PilN
MPAQVPISKDLRKLMAFGSGAGIEIGATDLEVVAARVRPSGVHVLGRLTIANFAERPAAEWGAEYTRFLKSHGIAHLSATVLLPRRDVIARHISLPGVAARDIESAIRFQLDSLHPYGDDEVCWGWSRLRAGAVLVGISRRSAVDRYIQLFTEAGVAVACFTFSAAAMHSAIRLNGYEGRGFVAVGQLPSGGVEVYGESEARPLFSAEFAMPPQRAAALGLSELRLPPDTPVLSLEQALPKPATNLVQNDLARNPLPYATALAGACPRFAPAVNVLPPEHRKLSSRAMYVPTAVLGALALLLAGGIWAYQSYADRKYLAELQKQIHRLEPQAQRAAALDRQFEKVQARVRLLDQYRGQTRADLDALNELTKLVSPPAWTNMVDLSRDTVRLAGEAPQAAPLVKILDSSPFFENSGTDLAQAAQGGTGEVFQIHASRRKR